MLEKTPSPRMREAYEFVSANCKAYVNLLLQISMASWRSLLVVLFKFSIVYNLKCINYTLFNLKDMKAWF